MSKYVKNLEIDRLSTDFSHRDLVVVSMVGMSARENHELRSQLRKKGIQVRVVKNSLVRRVLSERGYENLDSVLSGPVAVAWGGEGIVELSREIRDGCKKLAKLQLRGACVEGQTLDTAQAEKLSELPSRQEMLARLVAQILGPGSRLSAQIKSPGGKLASQIKSIGEPKESSEEPAAEGAVAPS